MMRPVCTSLALLALLGCSRAPHPAPDAGSTAPDAGPGLAHSSSIAVTRDGSRLFVVNADSDSVSVLDPVGRALLAEVPLAPSPPAPDATGAFAPAVMPRALALSPDEKTLYVTGQRSGALHVLDVASNQVRATVPLGSEPVGLLVSPDGRFVYAACAQDATVVRVDAQSLQLSGSVATISKPWALAWSSTGALLATHFLTPAVSAIDPSAMAVQAVWSVPDAPARGDKRLAHGEVRGLYDLAPRPGTDELWIAHVLLATDTPQPELNFESTVFPSVSVLHREGSLESQLSTNAQDVPGLNGAFADIVSGPHALAFTRDGAFALMVDTNSEDVLVIDAQAQLEANLLRPLPGHLPEGLVLSPDERHAYVDERNSGDVAVLDVARTDGGLTLAVDGAPIPRLQQDPMPAQLRNGQHLFYSANSDEDPLTQNHWVACATCHLEGRSDAVTWRFEQGPRDTPSNAGGMLQTGFLFRTADRTRVQDYWRTIDIEQGGHFSGSDPSQAPLLDAITAYVNYGIPYPVPPHVDPGLADAGYFLFHDPVVGCAGCHSGPAFTDSGAGNPTLDLDGGPVVLHDVGTCVLDGPFDDAAHTDIQGHARDACRYDTPTLRGIADSAPYLHDGSAATLADVLSLTRPKPDGGPGMGDLSGLSSSDVAALLEYVRSL
jgi:YVTN family beta-propeller protein